MKKNFLNVAALLIAAMLMVVSCSQEVAPKTEDNGLVDARLNIAYGRDLIVKGDSKAEDFYLEYTTEFQWANGNSVDGYTEGVEGAKIAELKADGRLGWLTPGYWKVTVKAYEKDATSNVKKGEPIFEGNTSAYFTSKASIATVFLEPVASEDNSISFDFTMQNLGTYDTDFVVKYSIAMNGSNLVSDQKFTTSEITDQTAPDGSNNQSKYKKTVNVIGNKKLASGYYTVTVSVYEVKNGDETLKGGISKGMLLAGNQATLSGHIEPSDYVGSNVEAYFVDVDTDLVATLGAVSNNNVTVTFTLTDSTQVEKYNTGLSGLSRTYIWNFDLRTDEIVEERNTPFVNTNQIVQTYDYTKPGPKNASCTTVYSYTDNPGTDKEKTYFWAETKSVQVIVPTTDFTY